MHHKTFKANCSKAKQCKGFYFMSCFMHYLYNTSHIPSDYLWVKFLMNKRFHEDTFSINSTTKQGKIQVKHCTVVIGEACGFFNFLSSTVTCSEVEQWKGKLYLFIYLLYRHCSNLACVLKQSHRSGEALKSPYNYKNIGI